MLFKSPVFTQASGSLAGSTYSRNRFGMYVRSRSLPVNPNSPLQVAVRNYMRSLSAMWVDTLTDAERNAWEVYGANVPVKNRVGDNINLTGLNHFIRSNSPRLLAGLTPVLSGPTVYQLAALTEPEFTVTPATDKINVTFSATDAWATESGGALLVFASRPQNPSINFFKGPYRYAGKILGDGTTTPTSPVALDAPFSVEDGQKVFARFAALRADGRVSSPFRLLNSPVE